MSPPPNSQEPPSPSPAASSLADRVLFRHHATRAMRDFFAKRRFVEVDTPQLVRGAGSEPHIDALRVAVQTEMHGAPVPHVLHTSPELSLKRVLGRAHEHGCDRVYQLSHVFRDGEHTAQHRPEFSMLEWYRVHADLPVLMQDCLELLRSLPSSRNDGFDFSGSPMVASVNDLWKQHAQIDLRSALLRMAAGDKMALVEDVKGQGHSLRRGADFEDAFFHIMMSRIEPKIGLERPCFVTRWPAQMAVYAKLCTDDALFAERFEMYAGGLELANAFYEVTDPVEMRRRMKLDNRHRVALGKDPVYIDEAFLADLQGLPATSGIALGFDRALMLLRDTRNIADVLTFP